MYIYMAGRATKIKLITFDAYNTLFKPKGNLTALYALEASLNGIYVSKDEINQHFGKLYRRQIEEKPFYGLAQGLTVHTWWEELVYSTYIHAGVSKKELDPKFDKIFNGLYNRFTQRKYYELFPDVTPTLEFLKKNGFQIGVISNTDERIIPVLRNLQLDTYFNFILSSVYAGYEKPSKQIFDKARTFCTQQPISPSEVLHVGDDEEKDYQGAINAGENAVFLNREKIPYEDSLEHINACKLKRESHDYTTISSLTELYPLMCNRFNNKLGE
ncbi:HAD-like domain-containing protein [Cokeromyces recurvatus]|uniref:HAD-like domain-containing protein n=1 Tax=Cokeromyces recurvatus TaxID=90255 RepID=UPI00221F8BD1|nr:HAD-like domain-containing protein [Cokeromyces recurvatus]KAI7898734.1 HAD-like domain-containing protein [Cokeromyces recurvatus]